MSALSKPDQRTRNVINSKGKDMKKTMRKASFLNNETGIILVTVIVLTIVLSIVAVGIMSLNVSQIKTSSSVVDTVRAEELATGLFYQDYQRRIDGKDLTYSPSSVIIDSKTYSISRPANDRQTLDPEKMNLTNEVQFTITY